MSFNEILLDKDVTDAIKNNQDYVFDVMPELKTLVGYDQNHPQHDKDLCRRKILLRL